MKKKLDWGEVRVPRAPQDPPLLMIRQVWSFHKCVFILHITIHFTFFNRDCIVSPDKTELLVVSDSKNIDDQNPHHDEQLSDQPDAEQTKHTEDSENKALIVCNDDKEDAEPTSNSANEKHNDDSDVLLLSDKSTDWSIEKLNKEFRKFNIDLHPRVRKCFTSLLCQ